MGGRPQCGDPILVADGDDISRALVTSVLERVGYKTQQARTGYEVLELAERRPRLVLLDVELTGVSGYQACRELRERHGDDLPLVFLSATRVESIDRIAGLLIGADDYIVKPFDPDELLARVRALLRRRSAVNGGSYDYSEPRLVDVLTRRERQVLDLLAQGRTQSEIARELYITSKTVATHIQRVLSKLGVHSRAQAVALVLANGRSSEIEAVA